MNYLVLIIIFVVYFILLIRLSNLYLLSWKVKLIYQFNLCTACKFILTSCLNSILRLLLNYFFLLILVFSFYEMFYWSVLYHIIFLQFILLCCITPHNTLFLFTINSYHVLIILYYILGWLLLGAVESLYSRRPNITSKKAPFSTIKWTSKYSILSISFFLFHSSYSSHFILSFLVYSFYCSHFMRFIYWSVPSWFVRTSQKHFRLLLLSPTWSYYFFFLFCCTRCVTFHLLSSRLFILTINICITFRFFSNFCLIFFFYDCIRFDYEMMKMKESRTSKSLPRKLWHHHLVTLEKLVCGQ